MVFMWSFVESRAVARCGHSRCCAQNCGTPWLSQYPGRFWWPKRQDNRLRPVFQAQCSEVLIFRSIKPSILLLKLINAPEAVDHLESPQWRLPLYFVSAKMTWPQIPFSSNTRSHRAFWESLLRMKRHTRLSESWANGPVGPAPGGRELPTPGAFLEKCKRPLHRLLLSLH